MPMSRLVAWLADPTVIAERATRRAKLIEAAENLADIEATLAARAEVEAEGTIPWDEVKADLGIE